MLRSALVLVSVLSLLPLAAPPAALAAAPPPDGTLLINELANGGPQSDADGFIELVNAGDTALDLHGWHLYRCSAQGLRANVGRHEGELEGILAPGAVFTISRTGMPGDTHVTQPYASSGFGAVLVGPDGEVADRVGVYPNEPWPTHSECSVDGLNLPNTLDFAAGESWQRAGTTGVLAEDWVIAPSSLGSNAEPRPAPRSAAAVQISEFAPAGPEGAADEFVELHNTGSIPVALDGWTLERCTAGGRLTPETRALDISGAVLAPDERWVIAGADFVGHADARIRGSFANAESGVLLRDAAGALVDRLAISGHGDSACQEDGAKLPVRLDPVAGESWQRHGDGFVLAPRTPGASNATVTRSVADQSVNYAEGVTVAISEVATDPQIEGLERRNYIELGNYSEASLDVGGWSVRRCQADGQRATEVQFTIEDGTRLRPGATYLAALAGTATALDADTTYDTTLNFRGTGLWLADAEGRLVDKMGVYALNEMDESNVRDSVCTKGLALTAALPDRLSGQTYQRDHFTGVDVTDFVALAATPGVIDLHESADPTARVVMAAPAATVVGAPARSHTRTPFAFDAAASVIGAWSGHSAGPLATRVGLAETPLDAVAGTANYDGYEHPYQRFELDAAGVSVGDPVGWIGASADRDEVQLSVWSSTAEAWRLLAVGSGADLRLSGILEDGDIVDGTVTLLAQNGPRTAPLFDGVQDGEFETPETYDFALTHITDTQYLSENHPEVYSQLVSWVVDNAEEKKIAFAAHTGDLIQNWVDPDQNESRARFEFERASAIQAILDEAGIPNSVLPGNHDNKRGATNALFNEYFPPERYAEQPGYGGSIAPGDNSASFSTFEESGARFLVLSLPYAYAEREIAWAESVVQAHPQHNVIIATHEHVMPKTLDAAAKRSTSSRWLSRGGELWERVIAPNRNVVLVLSGHFHGLGQLVTENAGGIEGHTVVEVVADYQEFRTHTGERATGFFRLLQADLDGQALAVDTRSVRLGASYSHEYDYRQFLPDNGLPTIASNDRPWNIVESGLQHRYTEVDDEFVVPFAVQRATWITTSALFAGSAASAE